MSVSTVLLRPWRCVWADWEINLLLRYWQTALLTLSCLYCFSLILLEPLLRYVIWLFCFDKTHRDSKSTWFLLQIRWWLCLFSIWLGPDLTVLLATLKELVTGNENRKGLFRAIRFLECSRRPLCKPRFYWWGVKTLASKSQKVRKTGISESLVLSRSL